MAQVDFKPLPPRQAIEFFRKKGFAISFAWQEIWQQEHAIAFTVAKATRLDILEDIREAVDKALAGGLPFAEFKKSLEPILQAKGWWGRKTVLDPRTGKRVLAQLGSAHRLRTIYDTNIRMAHAWGRWQRIEAAKALLPFLVYKDADDIRVRPEHAAWDLTVLPVDHVWWLTHYPPNGWKCRCDAFQMNQRQLNRRGLKVTKAPGGAPRPVIISRTLRRATRTPGIDLGFDYNVGKARYRAYTPPPLGGLPTSFPPSGPAPPPLPTARKRPARIVLPKDKNDSFYLDAFFGRFGIGRDEARIFTDKAGEDLVISQDLFRQADGVVKLHKRDRARFMTLMAETIQEPDEIWWIWEPFRNDPGRFTLRRRYLARWDLPGFSTPAVAVFEHGDDGWKGVTTFPVDAEAYLEAQRVGALAYRRPGADT